MSTLLGIKKISYQVLLVGTLPVLMAVVGTDDEETIIDSEVEYKEKLKLDFFDVIGVDGYSYGDSEDTPTWLEADLNTILEKVNKGEGTTGFAFS